MITSSGRSLWLRFKSDETIEYTGFKAVYSFIENPLDNVPDIGKCEFHGENFQEFIGSNNISDYRIEFSRKYDQPIDCVWTIKAEEDHKLYIQFTQYHLAHPNDCHLNYLQVYDEKPDEENLIHKFCGKAAESLTSKSNIVHVRFYAEKSGIQSKFSSVITAIKVLNPGASCDPETEYDCDDATCIHPDLVCNSIRNCKFGWDEEACESMTSTITMDFTATHVIIIMVLLTLILLGMCAGMLCNLYRKLSEDKEELAKSMASINKLGTEEIITTQPMPDGIEEFIQQQNQLPPNFPPTPVPILAMQLRDEVERRRSSSCHVPEFKSGKVLPEFK